MYVDSLTIKNLRSFEQAEMRLNYPGRDYPRDVVPPRLQNVNLLLGENGAGKSTVFRALCFGVLRNYLGTLGYRVFGSNVRIGADFAEVTVDLHLHPGDIDTTVASESSSIKEGKDAQGELVSATIRIHPHAYSEYIDEDEPAQWEQLLTIPYSAAFFLVGYGALDLAALFM